MQNPEAKIKIRVMASWNGSMMRALHTAILEGKVPAEIVLIISNNSDASVLKYAREHNISELHLSAYTEGSDDALDERICVELVAHLVDLVILSGWMKKIGPKTLTRFRKRVVNTHPARRDSGYEGKGMYGDHVHAAVLAAHETMTGVTYHFVDDNLVYDTGEVIEVLDVPVEVGDTLDTLRARVQAKEKEGIVGIVQRLAEVILAGKNTDRVQSPHVVS